MSMVREQILLNKINQLKNCIYSSAIVLDNWETRLGVFKSAGNYEIENANWSNIAIGTRWQAKDDLVRWFRRKITIPQELQGKEVVLNIEVGGEGLVYVNGEMISAITSYIEPREATRTRVLLSSCAKGNEVIDVTIEAGLNYMEFAKYRAKGMESVEYEFRNASLCQVNTQVEKYYFDVMVTYEVIQVLAGKTSNRIPKNIEEMLASFIKFDKYGTIIHDKLLEALENSLLALDFDFSPKILISSIGKAEEILEHGLNSIPHLPQGQMTLVGHSHIDTAWLWPIKETIKKCSRTFSNTLALLDEFPEHIFAQSQPQLYEYTKEYYPELYEEIKKKVEEGRWELVGNSWVECDTNVPSGESLVRQILYGKNFFKDEFGKWSDILWMPDVFGYSWALPQIIKRSGMEFFYTAKLNNNDVNRFPYSLFWWQGVDGTKVISYLQRATYNGEINPSFINELWTNYDEKELHDEVLGTYGFGDGGGGPTYEMLEYSKRLKNFPGMPKTKIDSAQAFFEKVKSNSGDLPLWNDEMYYEFHRGTYTSQANTKKNNRKSELLYRQSEIISSIVLNKLKLEYPLEELTQGWKLILLNQFHDIIPGSSINEVYKDCEKDYKKVFDIGYSIEDKALKALVNNINFENSENLNKACDSVNIVVFNFLSWPVTGLAQIIIPLEDMPNCSFERLILEDMEGNKVSCNVNKIDEENVKVCFEAFSVPSIGYASYKLTKIEQASIANETDESSNNKIKVTKDLMENDYFRIKINSEGLIYSIYDKKAERNVLTEGGFANELQIFEDRPARESAWNIDIEYQKKSWPVDNVKSIEVKEVSAIKGVLRVVKVFNNSEIAQDITIYASTPRIDFNTQVEWQETEKLLKAAFDVDILSSYATYEIAFGSIKRPTHWNTSWDKAKFEVPAHKWADLSEGGYGVSVLNDCKYGYDIKDNIMRITLLKAPIYPDPVADKGYHEFVYSLYPHSGDWISGNTVNAGYELNVPLKAVYTKAEGKDAYLPQIASFVNVDKTNVIIDSIKVAEDGDGFIMRLYESSGKRDNVKISTTFDIHNVTECNLMEEDEEQIELKDGVINIHIKPYEIKTLKMK